MAYAVTKIGDNYRPSNYREFIVDRTDDLASLPASPAIAAGSLAYCSQDKQTYILETDGDWAVKGEASDGSDDGGESGGESSGAGLFVVMFSMQDEDWVCDKTFAEIKAAYEAGMFIYGFSESNSEGEPVRQLSFQYLYESQNWSGACFHSGFKQDTSNSLLNYYEEYSIDAEEYITCNSHFFAEDMGGS